MALTPAEIDAFNKATGGAVPLNAAQTGGVQVKSRADRMLEIGKEVEAAKPAAPAPSTTENIGNEIITGIKNMQQKGEERGKAIAQPIADYKSGKQPDLVKAIGATAEQVISQTAGGVEDTFAEVVKRSGSFILNSLGIKPQVKKQAAAFADYLAKSPIAPGVVDSTYGDVANYIAQKAKEFAAAHPEFATHAQTVGNLVNAYLSVTGLEAGAIGAGRVAKKAADIVAPVVKPTLDAAGEIVESGVTATAKLPGKIKTKVGEVVGDVKTRLKGGRTLEEVLATPEKDVAKLSANEREVYFQNKKDIISAKAEAEIGANKALSAEQQASIDAQKALVDAKAVETKAKIDADLTAKNNASIEEAKKLQTELQITTRDKVLEIRPKAREALGKQSQQYRALVDEEISKVADTQVGHKEIGKFIDQKYAADEQMASAIKERLAIVDKAVTDPKTTIGELYNQSKSLGQDIGTGAKKGVRVFTPGEKLTDDAISTLVEYMQGKGIDLSKARQFWAQYAPIRNQLVSEGKIFLQADTQTKTLGNTISRVARGTDVHAENFINEVENLTGQSLTKEAKEVVAKLDKNAKIQLANKIEAESAKMEAELAKEQAKADLRAIEEANRAAAEKGKAAISKAKENAIRAVNEEKFAADRIARRRTIIKTVITSLPGLYVGNQILKNTTGIGF